MKDGVLPEQNIVRGERTGRCMKSEKECRNVQKHNNRFVNGMRDSMQKAGNEILNLIYPPRCPVCEEILHRGDGKVCPRCRKNLPYIEEPFCKKCGKPLRRQEQEYCTDCEEQNHEFLCGRAVFLYEKGFRRSVMRMKFQNHREYLDFYAEEMVREGERYLQSWRPGTILPVTVNKRKKRERGFDQSVLLAKRIGKLTGIRVETKALERNRYTLPQKDLNAKERRKNLNGAFTLRQKTSLQEPVLLIDDIYTTGATIDAVCRELKKNGIHRIYFLVICTGNGK